MTLEVVLIDTLDGVEVVLIDTLDGVFCKTHKSPPVTGWRKLAI